MHRLWRVRRGLPARRVGNVLIVIYMIWLYTILSVLIVSAISLIGVATLMVNKEKLEKFLMYFVSFSVGALLGDVFIHIIPEISGEAGFAASSGLLILAGIVLFFVIEKFVNWHHCHHVEHTHKVKPMAYTNLIGDGLHNFLDGVIIAASFMVSLPIGIATTVAVVLHEVPQEIGDFGVLLYAGFSRGKALLFNFLSASLSILGAVITLLIATSTERFSLIVLALAAGGFIYIAGSDLIPELHRDFKWRSSVWQLFMLIVGIAVMWGLGRVG